MIATAIAVPSETTRVIPDVAFADFMCLSCPKPLV
jgi:hypothetical protein